MQNTQNGTHETTSFALFDDAELEELVRDAIENEWVSSIGVCLSEEEPRCVQLYIVSQGGEYTADSPLELKGMLKAMRMMQPQKKVETPKPRVTIKPQGKIDPEVIEARMKEPKREAASAARADYQNPLHEALRITLEGYGQYREIHLTSLMHELDTFTRIEKDRLRDRARALWDEGEHEKAQALRKQADALRKEHWIEKFEAHRIAHVEKRPGSPHDYSVLIMNEQNDLVREFRAELDVYPRVA